MKYYYRENTGSGSVYHCILCQGKFNSHQAFSYHMFKASVPCISNINRERASEPEVVVEFKGERMSVPTTIVERGAHPEHRDGDGRLRVSGMLTGYRGWSVGRVGNDFRIFPVFRDWSAPYDKGVLTATCHSTEYRMKHSVPHLDCTCGFYASWSPEKIRDFTSSTNTFLQGRLKAFGKVLPGELGWRAQHVIVDGFYHPNCGVYGCNNKATKYIVRPNWYKPVSSQGAVFPRLNSAEYSTYRDTADFSASNISNQYLGWYCDGHEFTQLIAPRYEYICNYPKTNGRRRTNCKRPSTFALNGLPYSWCNEHAPFIFNADEVLSSLCNYYDVYLIDKEAM